MKSDEFIREVDEELQREKLARLWQQFGPWLIVAAVLVVLGTAGKVGWETWRDSRLQARAQAFAEAERKAGTGSGEAWEIWLAVAADASDGFASLARLRAAAALQQTGERERAAELLKSLASASDDGIVADLARLLAGQYRVEVEEPARLAAELEPLATAGRPFRHNARETMALAAMRADDRERARALLSDVADDATAPVSLQQRARELLGALGGSGAKAGS